MKHQRELRFEPKILLSLILLLCLTCPSTAFSQSTTCVEQGMLISNKNKYYYDRDNKCAYKFVATPTQGQYFIFIYPLDAKSKLYWDQFEVINKLNPKLDTVNDLYYYSDNQTARINSIISRKLQERASYTYVSFFTDKKYLSFEREETIVYFPHMLIIKRLVSKKWVVEKQIVIKNATEYEYQYNLQNLKTISR